MMSLHIETIIGYKPQPDYYFRIDENGTIFYRGRSYVGVVGEMIGLIDSQSLHQINTLSENLLKRNQKNYLKVNHNPMFSVIIEGTVKSHFKIDREDVVSEDIVSQIIDLAGIRKWIDARLDLYLVMSKVGIRTRELALLRAINPEQAISMHLADRDLRNYKSVDDYISFPIGVQNPGTILSPVIYLSYTDYQIQERATMLLLNQGPALDDQALNVFLFISFGKRYNDRSASYFMVLGKDKKAASDIFHEVYPHFMPNDFQQVDLEVEYIPNPLFETYIPIVIR